MANSEFDSRKDCNKSADQAAATRHAHRDEKHNQALVGEPFVTGASSAGGEDRGRRTGDPEVTSGSGKDGEDGVDPVVMGGAYGQTYTKPVGEQDFDAVHGHKTDIPWSSGQGSGFDRDWATEETEKQ